MINNERKIIAFDGDDTLWANEYYYKHINTKIHQFLDSRNIDTQRFEATKNEILHRNIPTMGYGMKVYLLSLIEAFCKINPSLPAGIVSELTTIVLPAISPNLKPFPGAVRILEYLRTKYTLILVTKGDLAEQTRKIESSGLRSYFNFTYIVTEKNTACYKNIFDEQGIDSQNFTMIGNSYPSDIEPIVELGGHAIYIPGETNETLEQKPTLQQLSHPAITCINDLSEIANLL